MIEVNLGLAHSNQLAYCSDDLADNLTRHFCSPFVAQVTGRRHHLSTMTTTVSV